MPAAVFLGGLPPVPLFTGAGHFGLFLISGGQNQDLFPSYSRPTGSSLSQSPLYSGRPLVGIRHVASLLLLSPPNPLRWALAGAPIMGSSNIHRLVRPYLLGAAVVGRTSCHGFAGVGGVLSAQYPPNLAQVGACVPGSRRTRRSCLCPPGSISNLSGGRPP